MSAAIDRLRDVLALCPTGGVFLGEDYVRTVVSALDALDAQRARAEAAEADVARLRRAVDGTLTVLRHLADGTALDHAYPALAAMPVPIADALGVLVAHRDAARAEVDAERALRREHGQRIGWAESVAASAMRQGLAVATLLRERREHLWARVRAAESDPSLYGARWIRRLRTLTTERDAARADAAALRAIVEGRSAPTEAEVLAHANARGRWLIQWSDGRTSVVRGRWSAAAAREPGVFTAVRWWALDATGRPTSWPTVTP